MMNCFRKLPVCAIVLLLPLQLMAISLEFDNLSEKDMEDIVRDMAGATFHSSVSSAGSLGGAWSFELGFVGGYAETPNIDRLVKEVDSNLEASTFPHGGILGRVQPIPSVVLEAIVLPTVEFEGNSFQSYSVAAQWNILDEQPVSLALKGHVNQVSLGYTQVVNSVDNDVKFDSQTLGAQLIASRQFSFVTPYAGLGYLNSNGEATVKGSSTFFDNTFSSDESGQAEVNSSQFLAGVVLNIAAINLGFEFAEVYDNSRYTFKVALSF